MASTYSTSLKIQLMGNGEDSGTWGSITNTNWNLTEQAIAGVQTITMANANYTLSNLNGVSDEARNMVLVVNGTNSGIYQVVAPLVNKFYVVSNQTAGGYAVTIGGATGSIVTVPSGTTVQVYCDGTNFYSAQTSSAGNFNVNGNLTVSGNQTDVGSLSAGSLSVSGSAAFSTSPTMPTPTSSDNSTKGATTAFVQTAVSSIVTTLTGTIQMWPTTSAPSGYLLCDGTAVSRSTYSALYALIGTTFGSGDGSTTFNLPNYTDRMPIGKGSIAASIGATGGAATTTLSSSNLPAHTHSASVTDPGHFHYSYGNGAPNGGGAGSCLTSGGGSGPQQTQSANTNISVAIGSTGSGTAATTISPYLGINFIIKT
jgi:microcystin-dependent protein